MYSLVKSLARTRGRTGSWSEVDLSAMDVFQLWTDYSRIYLILTNPFITGQVSLDLNEVRSQITQVRPGTTLTQWLVGLGNTSLPTSPTIPKIDPKFVQYRDAVQAGYALAPVHRTIAVGNDVLPSDMDDLLLTKDGLDYKEFYENVLVDVNGLLHYSDYSPAGVHVYGGNSTKRISNDNHVGLINFKPLGGVRAIPIRADQITAGGIDPQLYINAIISMDESFVGKTVMLSFMGYLLPMDRAFKRIGDSSFSLDLRNQVVVDWFFEAKRLIDLTSIENHLTYKNGGYNQIGLDEFNSDAVVKAMLTLSQTFLIVINNGDVYVDREQLGVSLTPDRYFTRTKPVWPVIFGKGRIFDYWTITENDTYVLAGADNQRPEYNFETTDWGLNPSIDNTQDRHNPFRFSKAYFLKIGSDF